MRALESFVPTQQFRYYYSKLNPNDKEAYRRIYTAYLHHDTEVHFEDLDVPAKHLDYLTTSVVYDTPVLLNAYKISEYLPHPETNRIQWCHIEEKISLTEHIKELEVCEQQVQRIAAEVQAHPCGIARVKAVHDWFAQNCTYDEEKRSILPNHSAYGALSPLRQSVCEGFSLSAKMCYDYLEIPSIAVCGYAFEDKNSRAEKQPFYGNHVWIMVQIGDTWYHMDITQDIADSHSLGTFSYNYFLLSDNTTAKNHQFNAGLFPKAPRDCATKR